VGAIFRTSDVVLIAAMVAAAAFTYKTKYEAEARLSELNRIERQIRLEKDSIDVLKADWSLLTQPARIQRLVENYEDQLDLQPVEPTQIGSIADLPQRPLEIEDLIRSSRQITAQAPTDAVTTGGIGQ
jgi:hypothetical protein